MTRLRKFANICGVIGRNGIDGERIRQRRDELDMSSADLAARLGISEGYFRNICGGSDRPRRRVIYRIARVLDLPLDEIWDPNTAELPPVKLHAAAFRAGADHAMREEQRSSDSSSRGAIGREVPHRPNRPARS